MGSTFSRLVYSPECQVFIQPGGYDNAPPIDISNDIISGSITRKSDDVSKASFLVQSRKNKDNRLLFDKKIIRPMDRIVVYLKKVKPLLVFSGYLDLVPLFQAVPEPFTIEASCTLKRLEFSYWDPQLPHVFQALSKYGFAPTPNGQGGLSFWVPPDMSSAQTNNSNTQIQDTGFGAMLEFLLTDVGGWDPKTVHIEPLPTQWMQRASLLFQVQDDWDQRYGAARDFLAAVLTSGGNATSGGGDGGGGTGTETPVTISNASTIKGAIEQDIKKYSQGTPKMTADDFMIPGQKYDIDPRFLAALALAETHYGTAARSSADVKNCYGYKNSTGASSGDGLYYEFQSFTKCVDYVADVMRNKHYYIGENENQTLVGFLESWNLSSDEERGNISEAWRRMATSSVPVDVNKPYSATGQGIGTRDMSAGTGGVVGVVGSGLSGVIGAVGAIIDQTRDSAADGGGSNAGTTSNDVLSVYIEAGHAGAGSNSGEAQPGYQNQPGSDAEYNKNVAVINKIKDIYNGFPQAVKDKLQIEFITNSSRPRGWVGDVYLSIHHDPQTFPKGSSGIGYVCQYSVKGQDSVIGSSNKSNQGKSGPNEYSDGGSGWKKPSALGEGRDVINTDSNLIKNSSAFGAYLQGGLSTKDTGTSYSLKTDGKAKNNRMVNYYGFYYSNARACALLECPADSSSRLTNIANGILIGLLKYQDWKKRGNQKDVTTGGTTYNGGSATSSDGDTSAASNTIAAAIKAADYNEANWKLGYNMDERHPNASIEEIIDNKWSTDCSSFIYACMRSAGIFDGSAATTVELYNDSEKIADKSKFEPGDLFIRGGSSGSGANGHVAIVIGTDGKCAESTRQDESAYVGPDRGPQYHRTAQDFIEKSEYELCRHHKIGTTLHPPTSGGTSDSSGTDSAVNAFLIAKSAAFNVAFNFPGSFLESSLLTGERALENDVKLIETVQEVCKASQRNFSSLPNGDFIAWYPDYFNLTGANPWLRISPTEVKSCTISLNDRELATHVYILGNPLGFNQQSGNQIQLEWMEKLMGSGVVTLERPWVLDSFLRPFAPDGETNQSSNQDPSSEYLNVKRPRPILETKNGRLAFLERYGARPYFDKVPTIRHPILEFFYAYHTFIQKWAAQFISRAEFTFMPELMPGMIVELEMKHTNSDSEVLPDSVTFYVHEVTHNFSYEGGFSTEALLLAPGTINSSNEWAMVAVRPPDGKRPVVKSKKIKKNNQVKNSRTKRVTTTVTDEYRLEQLLQQYAPIQQTDGGSG